MKIIHIGALVALGLSLSACETVTQLVNEYGGEKGLALLEKAADGADNIEDATIGNAVKALPKYCILPGAARSLFRDRINARPEAGGAKIGIFCPGDPALTLGAAQ